MATELIVNASLPETRIALMENGEIQEILVERAQGKGIVGNIYKGRVTRVLPGMQAAFVDIGLEKAAFLYVDDVYVHSEIWAEEEGHAEDHAASSGEEASAASADSADAETSESGASEASASEPHANDDDEYSDEDADRIEADAEEALAQHPELLSEEEAEEEMAANLAEEEEDEDEDDGEGEGEPVGMDAEGGDDEDPKGTLPPPPGAGESHSHEPDDSDESDHFERDSVQAHGSEEGSEGGVDANDQPIAGETDAQRAERGRRRRRGRRGGRNRRRGREEGGEGGERIERQPRAASGGGEVSDSAEYPEQYRDQVSEAGDVQSDRSELSAEAASRGVDTAGDTNRPEGSAKSSVRIGSPAASGGKKRAEFNEPRDRNRRIKSKGSMRPSRAGVNIQDLLKEGQEVIVQVAKDPIATKGARLTCHISLPGRHLVCMPTIDHVGVSRRIEKDEERRRLREYVDRNRPKGLGFIVRTATSSGKMKAEARIKQDVDYLSALWSEIKSKANAVSAPALVYEDLNPVLRAIRDWVNEDIDKIVVDSRYHYNDVTRFVRNFMPSILQKVELYSGDVPIFDAYGISAELARALERKVWLKSGGYLVIDQAEALVAIDVNTGRFVGKKSLEDTILKTNLEAVKEICYQLRLRNCGGIIILDLIDMEKEENKLRVYRALEEELKKDRSRPQILKISELGLVEMTRKRTRDTMVRALCDSCTQCEGKGYIKSKTTVAYEILREIEREGVERDVPKILVQGHPDVIDALAIDERDSLDQLERRYKKQIYLQAVPDFHPEQFEISNDKRGRSDRSEDALLERARELAQTQDRGRRGRRDRGRGGKDREQRRSSGRNTEGGGEERGGRDRDRGRGRDRDRNRDRDREEQPRDPNRPRISIRAGGASAPAASEEGHSSNEAENQQRFDGIAEPSALPPRDDFATDEDRLAYQRAQAAQDAALAGGGAPAANGNRAGGGGGGRWSKAAEGGGDGGSRGRRGRRGRRGGRGRFQRGFRGEGTGAPATEGASTAPSSGGGESSGGGDGGGGGGGDHSTPPA